MKYLFWNTNNVVHIDTVLIELIETYTPNIFALAEYNNDGVALSKKLQAKGLLYEEVPQVSCRVRIFTNIKINFVDHGHDNKYFTIKFFPYNKIEKHIIAFVHFPSKLRPVQRKNDAIIREMMTAIKESSENISCKKVIIMGDFNMNPFEESMVSADALHAVSTRKIARKGSRKIDDITYDYMYNPMWNFIGDLNSMSGTYYYASSDFTCFYWNTFDQFLISPDLIDDLELKNIKIINSVNTTSLCSKTKPKISDHLPIYFELGGK